MGSRRGEAQRWGRRCQLFLTMCRRAGRCGVGSVSGRPPPVARPVRGPARPIERWPACRTASAYEGSSPGAPGCGTGPGRWSWTEDKHSQGHRWCKLRETHTINPTSSYHTTPANKETDHSSYRFSVMVRESVRRLVNVFLSSPTPIKTLGTHIMYPLEFTIWLHNIRS